MNRRLGWIPSGHARCGT